ncbi:MAG: hypothetical protein IJS45_09580 [Clostridia bacterium]|nr:hypothetical protein [Clostridia bacterium]
MKYTPQQKNKTALVASLVLTAAAAVLFFLGTQYYTKGRAIVQASAVVFLSFAAYFIIKRLNSYTYTVYPKDDAPSKSVSELMPGDLDLVISRRFASGVDTNRAKLDLGTLVRAEDLPATYSERRKYIKSFGKMTLFYYTVTISPPESLLLIFELDNSSKLGLVIEPDRDLRGFFIEAARLNKLNKEEKKNAEDEEEED